MDFRTVTSLIWGIMVLLLYGYILAKRIAGYRQHRDRRSRRDFAEAVALFHRLYAGLAPSAQRHFDAVTSAP